MKIYNLTQEEIEAEMYFNCEWWKERVFPKILPPSLLYLQHFIELLLGEGMKEAKSVKCYDSKTNCAEVLGWKGGCHKHGEDCKKVRPCLHSYIFFVTPCSELWTLRRRYPT